MFTSNQKPESNALIVHWSGLNHLYSFVKKEEQQKVATTPSLATCFYADFGSSDTSDIIFNHFLWYSASFLPFIDLFTRAYSPTEILRSEFSAVKKWRNKVSAHYSLVSPGDDSLSVQTASVNQFISWDNGRFSIGREVLVNTSTGESTPNDWGWELTEVHERLLPILKRYT